MSKLFTFFKAMLEHLFSRQGQAFLNSIGVFVGGSLVTGALLDTYVNHLQNSLNSTTALVASLLGLSGITTMLGIVFTAYATKIAIQQGQAIFKKSL